MLKIETKSFRVRSQDILEDTESNLGPWVKLSRSKLYFRFRAKLNNYAVCSVFSFVLFSSPPRSFFRLNHVRKVRKRCSHSRFSFQATILGVFDRSVCLCCSCFSVANGRRNYLSQAMTRGEKKF